MANQFRSPDRLFKSLAKKILLTQRAEGLRQADAALIFASLYRQHPGFYLWLCHNNQELETMAENLRVFLPRESWNKILLFPGSETDPYRGLSPHPEISARRAVTLWRILRENQGLLLTTLSALTPQLPSPENFKNNCIELDVGRFFPLDHLTRTLAELGYVREDPVSDVGEYSIRGGIVDIFLPFPSIPVRVEFFGDEIDSIREFDPASQRSTALLTCCHVAPMRELAVTADDVARWHNEAPEHWSEIKFAQALDEKLQFTVNGELFNGFEYLLPLVKQTNHHLLDYLQWGKKDPPNLILSDWDQLLGDHESLRKRWQQNYKERISEGVLVLPLNQLCIQEEIFQYWPNEHRTFHLDQLVQESRKEKQFDFQIKRRYLGQFQQLLKDLENWIKKEQVLFVISTPGLANQLVKLLHEYDIHLNRASSFEDALGQRVAVILGSLSEGFYSSQLGLHVLTEKNIFQESSHSSSPPRIRKDVTSNFLSDFRDLREGDYVVHLDHGIGVFQGLSSIGVGRETREFVVLTFYGDDKLYVPTDHLDLIQKYRSSGQVKPRVDRLGGVSWEKTKKRIKKSMQWLAQDLLKLYARREVAKGHSFPEDDALTREFEDAFQFEETPDQAAAIQSVKEDMMSPRPMDRLICGDVGYGKTEVAMRAAFRAVNDSKQVAVLAPTTVLAFQHYNTFLERFNNFPVSLGMISRFRNRAEQKQIIENSALGKTDILIGTHRILSRDIQFRDLGLIVVDEEQRFGVAQKERLKRLKTQVDVLTLSATPIPRTLNMSLTGVRDLSIIETPPKDRLAIQTAVVQFSRQLIHAAIDLELKRQGQVLMVHNSVETIYSIAQMVQETVPEARIAVGHGQMRENHLEKIMVDFLNYRYDVLVSTTIIENGLDIPRANTLLVNHSHRFGLSQLYQLRGRVGRSNRRAYAYLLIPSEETLSTDATRRLAAIREFSELGSGFRIAALDLEIRGSGNLLGQEQHGQINSVGFELYMKLLQETVQELKGEKTEEEIQTSIDLGLDIQIPHHYISDPNLRLWLYKRVGLPSNEAALANLKEEVTDRFGRYPNSISNLFEYAGLRLWAQRLRISSVDRKDLKVLLKFQDDTPISPSEILGLVHQRKDLTLSQDGILTIQVPSPSAVQLFSSIKTVLEIINARIVCHE